MRGKRIPPRRSRSIPGLIPAHAGKTIDVSAIRLSMWAHPRACGENAQPSAHTSQRQGSSPRMRGKPTMNPNQALSVRLIPAHAGKTELLLSAGVSRRAHPRACGENSRPSATLTNMPGSSPRMRGKRTRGRLRPRNKGLIPAHAGKTSIHLTVRSVSRAHPRACGENRLQ